MPSMSARRSGAVGAALVQVDRAGGSSCGVHVGRRGHGEGRQAGPVLTVDVLGVVADVERVGGRGDLEGARRPAPCRGSSVSGTPVSGSRAAMPSRATAPGPSLVAAVGGGVVLPPLVAADVDGLVGDARCRRACRRRCSSAQAPGRRRPAGAELPAGGGVAQGAGAEPRARGVDHEPGPVGGDLDVAHVGVEHAGAGHAEGGRVRKSATDRRRSAVRLITAIWGRSKPPTVRKLPTIDHLGGVGVDVHLLGGGGRAAERVGDRRGSAGARRRWWR